MIFIIVVFSVLTCICIAMLFFDDEESTGRGLLFGILWGIALVGFAFVCKGEFTDKTKESKNKNEEQIEENDEFSKSDISEIQAVPVNDSTILLIYNDSHTELIKIN